MAGEFSDLEKRVFLQMLYFGTTDAPGDDVNPYDSVSVFLTSTVGSLRWGIDQQVRQRSKARFAFAFSRILVAYEITNLDESKIADSLGDDTRTNMQVVDGWVAVSKFPPRP
ncbi:MAG: hypothetical protein HY699_14210 [Deltaproteobacteria bacterium]|nr:hypothetical protein [Deltaproteobacteria bacterium]